MNASIHVSSASEISDDGGDREVPPGHFVILPPPEATYSSRKEAEDALHEHSKNHGIDWAKKKTGYSKDAEGKPVAYKIHYHCTRGGRPPQQPSTVRPRSSSQRCNCKAVIVLKAVVARQVDGPWLIHHNKGQATSNIHNHPPAEDIRSCAGHRRRARTEQVRALVTAHTAVGVSTAQTLAILENVGPGNLQTPKDIYNIKMKERAKAGKRP